MTPTGRAAGADIAARLPGRVLQTYLPYDLPYAVRRFLRAFRPVLGISVETEAWPNLVAIASEQRIPMALVNARLSERSYRLSRRYAALMRETAARFSLALAQTRADADRIRQVGAKDVEVTGNLKFDFAPDEVQIARGKAWRRLLGDRPVWLFASTRDGEEAMILDAIDDGVDATIVIVPRHPQRFDEVAQMIEARGLPLVRRSSSNFEADHQCKVFLGDSMGEMTLYYAAADVAFIGGSLLHLGGQNLIEACAVGTPVVVGPHTFNFEQATHDAIEAGAAIRVADARRGCRDDGVDCERPLAAPANERGRAEICRRAPRRDRTHASAAGAVYRGGVGGGVGPPGAIGGNGVAGSLTRGVDVVPRGRVVGAGGDVVAGGVSVGGLERCGDRTLTAGSSGTVIGSAGSSSALTAAMSSSPSVPAAAFNRKPASKTS